MREDLELEEYAKKMGYKIRIKHPNEAYTFVLDSIHIWFNTYDGPHWQRAELVDGSFRFHGSYDTLKEALDVEFRKKLVETYYKYCEENGLPEFTLGQSWCQCGYDLFSKMETLEDAKTVISGCPSCHRSYCD